MPPASGTPAEAVEHYRGRTVRLLSCVTSVHVVVRAYHLSDVPHELELADTAKMRDGPLAIDVAEEYEVRQDADGWRVEIVGYLYAIGYEGRELVSYHWHPRGTSPITWPHMHVGSDIHVGARWFGKVHLPTGVVGLERVVALAIAEHLEERAVERGSSCSSSAERIRGRLTGTRRPPSVIDPSSWP
jgi:hypothetical protein